MLWIYILKDQNDFFYVGKTERLYRRFYEHIDRIGGENTENMGNLEIVAIYKANTIFNFNYYNEIITYNIIDDFFKAEQIFNDFVNIEFNFDEFSIENDITECLMVNSKDWTKIRGGKYVRFDCKYKYPQDKGIFPVCHCNLPCDVNKRDNFFYFRCPKKNFWDDLREEFFINEEPCKFFKKYEKDINFPDMLKKRREYIKELFNTSRWLKRIRITGNYPYPCEGGCERTSESIKINYDGFKRDLCFDCFINKNEELKNKYDIENICML